MGNAFKTVMNLPSIYTNRLILKPLDKKDLKGFYNVARHEKVAIPAGYLPHVSLRDTEAFFQYIENKRKNNQPGPWVIINKANDMLIGTIELHSYKRYKAEVGFVMHPDYWRQGFMKEALKAVMVYAFENLGLKRLAYHHFLDNKASHALRDSLNFTFEGIRRKNFDHADGRILDEAAASFTDDDYHQYFDTMFKAYKKTLTYKK